MNPLRKGTVTPNIINFVIDSTSYQTEEGMFWYVWVNSSYNTINLIAETVDLDGGGSITEIITFGNKAIYLNADATPLFIIK